MSLAIAQLSREQPVSLSAWGILLLLTHCPILLFTYMHAVAGHSYVKVPTVLYIALLSSTPILLSILHSTGPVL